MYSRFFGVDGKYYIALRYLILFSLLYILPVLLANFHYIDDLGRSLTGYTGWEGNGRPLVSLFAVVLSNGKPLLDLSPWIQILSVIVLSYALILFLRKYTPNASSFKLFCIAAFSYLNLFMLENLSYKYDSFGMILSLSVFLVLYSFPNDLNLKKQFVLSILAVVVSLSLYQAAIGAYISLGIVESLYLILEGACLRDILKKISLRVCAILCGGFIYKATVVQIFVPKTGYSAEHGAFVKLFSLRGIQEIYRNSLAFIQMFKAYGTSMKFLGLLLLLALFIGIIYLITYAWKNRLETTFLKLLLSLFIAAAPFLLVAASVFSLILLKSPVVAPRVMISFSVFTLFVGMVIYRLSEWKKPFVFLSIFTLIFVLSFSSAYGNLLTRQEKMNSLVASYLVSDMNEIEDEKGFNITNVSFIGKSPKCRELLLAARKRPLFNFLIPIYMNNGWYWGGQYLSHYRKNTVYLKNEKDDRLFTKTIKPARQNEFYSLYLRGKKMIVMFQ
ncbi:MAG: glucosyltransferase domain-containing protein [Succiniclasticum sp.]